MILEDENKPTKAISNVEVSPGKILLWGRERAGLTQEQVAEELYMTLTRVRALENDDYRHITSQTFARGYLRAYSGLLKLDAVQVLAAYERYLQKVGLADELHPPQSQEIGGRGNWRFVLIVLATLAGLWLVSVWFFDNRQQSSYAPPAIVAPSVAIGTSSSVSSDAVVDVVDSVSITGVDEDLTGVALQPAVEVSASSAAPQEHAASSKSAQIDGLDLLKFSFSGECWLEVSDARGDVLATDLQAAGSQLTLRGVAPFKVKLGNARVAQVRLNEQAITLLPTTTSGVLDMSIDN